MNKTTTAISDIEKTMQEIFFKNLFFLKKSFPNIYDKLIQFENLNLTNYTLEFENNQFQLKNTKSNSNLYEQEPFQDAINRINNFQFSSAFNLIKVEPLEKKNHYKSEINSYEYLNEFIDNFYNAQIKLDKFIFIGTLLGIHINDFHKAVKAKAYLIIEPDIEIFRLSLFLTDYTVLFNDSKIFFVVNEENSILNTVLNDFLTYKYESNNQIYFELANKSYTPYIKDLSLFFTHQSEMRYPFSDSMISLSRLCHYFLNNDNKLLNLSKTYKILENYEVLILGAGPSLEKNLDFISLYKDEYLIIAVAATLKTLESKNIIPDIIVSIDGQNLVKNQFQVSKHIYENSIILTSSKLDKEIYSIFESNNNLYFFQDSVNIIDNIGNITGVTVGDTSIELALRLGAKNLYLLGIDAAIDSRTGKTHTSNHIGSKNVDLNKTNMHDIDFSTTLSYVKGNFTQEVPTFLEYTEMIEEINLKFNNLNNSFKIFNLSDGAYFNNTIPLKTSKIKRKKKLDKIALKKIIIKNLESISTLNIKKELTDKINEEKDILLKINLDNKNIQVFDNFKKIQKKYPKSIFINILNKYFKLILPYYYFLKDTHKANSLLNKQITQIVKKLNSLI